jgi:hypothetical protein
MMMVVVGEKEEYNELGGLVRCKFLVCRSQPSETTCPNYFPVTAPSSTPTAKIRPRASHCGKGGLTNVSNNKKRTHEEMTMAAADPPVTFGAPQTY